MGHIEALEHFGQTYQGYIDDGQTLEAAEMLNDMGVVYGPRTFGRSYRSSNRRAVFAENGDHVRPRRWAIWRCYIQTGDFNDTFGPTTGPLCCSINSTMLTGAAKC
jgi:hypothetical protein